MKSGAATKDLGLAAYMKSNGASLVSFKSGTFIFDTALSLAEWRLRYINSCCRKHDLELLELRRLARLNTPMARD